MATVLDGIEEIYRKHRRHGTFVLSRLGKVSDITRRDINFEHADHRRRFLSCHTSRLVCGPARGIHIQHAPVDRRRVW